jgi:hypothetical protein
VELLLGDRCVKGRAILPRPRQFVEQCRIRGARADRAKSSGRKPDRRPDTVPPRGPDKAKDAAGIIRRRLEFPQPDAMPAIGTLSLRGLPAFAVG